MNQTIEFIAIGKIISPYIKLKGTPIQPNNKSQTGKIEIFADFMDGLIDLEGFSHLIVIYLFHLVKKTQLKVIPFMDTVEHGIFATRSPARPNKIGLSVLRIIEIKKNIITVEGIDIINETPVLDIKPYVPQFDSINTNKIGWLEHNVYKQSEVKDDERFL